MSAPNTAEEAVVGTGIEEPRKAALRPVENRTINVAVAGNPNSGKSTLINAIAGTRLQVGNWPGVTVEKKEGSFEHAGRKMGIPVVIALNIYDEAQAKGYRFDVAGIEKMLGVRVIPDVGIFARYSSADGQTETYAFAEIERSLTTGLSVRGRPWQRDGDTLGVAWAMNGLSEAHRDYLSGGGLGFLIGDGRLDHHRSEQILEAYYSFNAFRGLWFTVDAQHIANPA